MKVRDAIRELKDAGFEPIRQGSSSHQQWSHAPLALHITLVVNHRNDDLSPVVLKNFKQVMRAVKAARDAERQTPKVANG